MKKLTTWSLITLAVSAVLMMVRNSYFAHTVVVNPSQLYMEALSTFDALVGLGILLPIAALVAAGVITVKRKLMASTTSTRRRAH
jgi:hypothetical protein